MQDAYVGEDDRARFRGTRAHWQNVLQKEHGGPARMLSSLSTHYMSQSEAAASRMSLSGGTLVDPSGNAIDTSAASGIGTKTDSPGRHIYVMTEDGEFLQADAWAGKQLQGSAGGMTNLAFINHSSFVQGRPVAGAGEFKSVEGQLRQLGDQSGHYRTDGDMMGNTIDELERQGIDADGFDLNFGPKADDELPLYMSTAQFRAQPSPATAEARVRAQRGALHADLRRRRAPAAVTVESPDLPPAAQSELLANTYASESTELFDGAYATERTTAASTAATASTASTAPVPAAPVPAAPLLAGYTGLGRPDGVGPFGK